MACNIFANKSKSIGAILLVISAVLTLITLVVQVFFNYGVDAFGEEINMHTILINFNLVVYLIFGLGLLLFAIEDRKKHN